MRLRAAHWLTIVGAAFFAAACGSSSGGGNGTSTTFEGVIVGDSLSGGLSGSISLTIATTSLSIASPADFDLVGVEAVVNVTGTLTISGGSTISLSGTYDTGTHALNVSGSGYTFIGTFNNGVLSGTFTTPGGGSGSFASSSTSGSGNVYKFCGNAVPNGGGGGATFNLVISTGAGTANGFAYSKDGTVQLTGTASGSNWSISFTTPAPASSPGTASGTFTSSSLSGTYSIPAQQETGTVSGSPCS